VPEGGVAPTGGGTVGFDVVGEIPMRAAQQFERAEEAPVTVERDVRRFGHEYILTVVVRRARHVEDRAIDLARRRIFVEFDIRRARALGRSGARALGRSIKKRA
jgi:hypothetical protein